MTLRGAAIVYLGAMVVLPVAAVITKGFGEGLEGLRTALNVPGAVAAIKLTLITSTLAAIISAVMGTMLAYVLVRYSFPGRRTLSAVVDLPLAIPTLVTGVMLVALYGPNSMIGGFLADLGIEVIFTPIAIMLALLVVTLPLVVRSVQPVLQELDPAEEEAAAILGANSWTTFSRVVLPAIRPAIVGGTLLTFARCLGEFGSVVLVAGNVPNKTLTAPVFIFQLSTQFRPMEAAAVATILFALSFVLVLATGRLLRRKEEA
ncbi:MAG TPA: sulfate ABC transporter permease subunit CysT [Actinomycetota bacterium]